MTAAFLSHAHADHIGGFVAGNAPVFPNAALFPLKAEVALELGIVAAARPRVESRQLRVE